MILKLIGAMLIIAACGGVGFYAAAIHRREEKTLRQFVFCLDFMECELQYHLTPLPELCRQTAAKASGPLSIFYTNLVIEFEDQISPDTERCVMAALAKVKDMPGLTRESIELLGRTLGRFDIEGQLSGLEATRQECHRKLEELTHNQTLRLRSYQTLGLCAGAALAILLM